MQWQKLKKMMMKKKHSAHYTVHCTVVATWEVGGGGKFLTLIEFLVAQNKKKAWEPPRPQPIIGSERRRPHN